jgi:hypothetical protein
MFSKIFSFLEYRAFYEVMWKNIVEPGRTQVATWRMRITCWTSEYKNVHSECVIRNTFVLQKWLYKRSSLLRLYVRFLSC